MISEKMTSEKMTSEKMTSEKMTSEKMTSEKMTSSEVYVVYVYVDYRKEIGTRILRTYKKREEAIKFAQSLSTEYKVEKKVKNEEDEEEEEIDANRESEYCIVEGTEFDARLKVPSKEWPKYGINDKHLWYLRIAVDKSLLF
jgi:hypothetical protein